jgi:hypothetical protein
LVLGYKDLNDHDELHKDRMFGSVRAQPARPEDFKPEP